MEVLVDQSDTIATPPVVHSPIAVVNSPTAIKQLDTVITEEFSMEAGLLTPPSSTKYGDSKKFEPEDVFTPLMLDASHIAPSTSQQQIQSDRSILPSSLSLSLQDTYLIPYITNAQTNLFICVCCYGSHYWNVSASAILSSIQRFQIQQLALSFTQEMSGT
jgi:hypothetical protein